MRMQGFLLSALGLISFFAATAPAARAQTITCSSENGRRNYCPANTDRADVRMVRQRSDARCIQGSTWGYDRRGIWVDRGCRADFLITYRRPDRPSTMPVPGPGRPPSQTITCASENMRRNYCAADTRRGVQLLRQRSDARCIQGRTWGFDRRGIWVDRGCRADFLIR